MNAPQRIIENLLLVTGASRALFQLARSNGEFGIEAEAVQHAQGQMRHGPEASVPDAHALATVLRDKDVLIEHDLPRANSSEPYPIRSRMLAPLVLNGRIVGVISLHHSCEARWSARDSDAMLHAQAQIRDLVGHKNSLEPAASEDLRSAATQAILDRVRTALDVQRSTFRQPVQASYAFPVTFESRADGVMSLLGDFTIIQVGQPVIVKLLAERRQVVQEDCEIASIDPLFHKMLAHYGGMRAQVVTPFIVDDQLKGVLSVHELRNARRWTSAERALAAEAAGLIGTIFEMPQPARS